ncbi:MAG: hypothetical protein LJE83_14425 [Gammaproteobacteria bacterium]|nr:hypothetical protein [Gammaproteobacteria bacterium]
MTINSILNSDSMELAIKYQRLLYAERDEILSNGGSVQDFLNSSVYKQCIEEITRIQSIHSTL